jgi:hypothetical protein
LKKSLASQRRAIIESSGLLFDSMLRVRRSS